MTLRRSVVWIGAVALLAICDVWLDSCFGAGRCLSNVSRAGGWWVLGTAATASLAMVTVLAWIVRIAWLAVRWKLDLHQLPRSECPADLEDLVRRSGISRARLLDVTAPVAFCAGVVRPTVYLSHGLRDLLTADELQAVLLHEAEHARVNEPLRRAARTALAEVCFYVPLLRWWAARRVEESELQADRAAILAMGAPVVARALWTTSHGLALSPVASFSGAVRLRVAQLLGDEIPLAKPDSRLVILSIVGSGFALSTMWCFVQIILGPRGFTLPIS